MVIGFKGEVSKLKNLYKELNLKEIKAENFDDLEKFIKNGEENIVIVNYNDLMVYDNATADIVEKKVKIMKAVKNCKKNLYLGLSKEDASIDKIQTDLAICTSVIVDPNKPDDMNIIRELYNFLNTDLAYNGKLADNEYAVKKCDDLRASAKTLSDIKKLLK